MRRNQVFYGLTLLLLVGFLVACGNENTNVASTNRTSTSLGSNDQSPSENNDNKFTGQGILSNEVIEGDFRLTLYTGKSEYQHGEEIDVYAELTYIGDEDNIEIGHAMSPVGFNLYEHTRGIEVWGAMAEPYRITKMIPNEPLLYPFTTIGGYGENDPKEVISFNKATMIGVFPKGQYTIYAGASFRIHSEEMTDLPWYKIQSSIEFEVK